MTEKITFRATDKYFFDIIPKPFPASDAIPDWWKKSTPYIKGQNNPDGKNIMFGKNIPNFTFKKCTPMLDGLSSGYMIPLWSDVYVHWENNLPIIDWKNKHAVFEPHGSGAVGVEPPLGYSPMVVKFLNRWIPQTPKGYSCLIINPVGYNNSPLRTISAVIDSDKTSIDMPFPMWIKNGFTGILEKGMPLVQVIPFKRTNWKSDFSYFEDGELDKIIESGFNSTIMHHYTKNIWNRKEYK